MSTIKVNLNVILPGRIMFSEKEVLKKTSKSKTIEDNTKVVQQTITVRDSKEHQKVTFTVRKSVPAKQSLNITKTAYNDMVSNDNCPHWVKPFMWKNMSKKQRLESHLQRIVNDLKGESFTYHIFED